MSRPANALGKLKIHDTAFAPLTLERAAITDQLITSSLLFALQREGEDA